MKTQDDFPVEVERLGQLASDLRCLYREGEEIDRNHKIVTEYNAILDGIIENGFTQGLDFEDELPDRLLTNRYLRLIEKLK